MIATLGGGGASALFQVTAFLYDYEIMLGCVYALQPVTQPGRDLAILIYNRTNPDIQSIRNNQPRCTTGQPTSQDQFARCAIGQPGLRPDV